MGWTQPPCCCCWPDWSWIKGFSEVTVVVFYSVLTLIVMEFFFKSCCCCLAIFWIAYTQCTHILRLTHLAQVQKLLLRSLWIFEQTTHLKQSSPYYFLHLAALKGPPNLETSRWIALKFWELFKTLHILESSWQWKGTHQHFRKPISKRCYDGRICETWSCNLFVVQAFLEFVLQSLSGHLKMSDSE